MSANYQNNMLNIVAVRASYILPILRRFLSENPRKPGGVVYLPSRNNANRNHFAILSFGVDPLDWQSFTEIGEMVCSTTAWCSRGHALKIFTRATTCLSHFMAKIPRENKSTSSSLTKYLGSETSSSGLISLLWIWAQMKNAAKNSWKLLCKKSKFSQVFCMVSQFTFIQIQFVVK